MHLSAVLLRRLHRFQLPAGVLIALLQRAPALRLAATAGERVLGPAAGVVLKSSVALAAALGAVNSLAGATPLVPSSGSATGISVAKGAAVSVFYTVSGTQTPPMSWAITGATPPGLNFSGLTGTGSVNVGSLHLQGTPTTPGSYALNLQTFEFVGTGGVGSPVYSYTITVTGPSSTAPAFTTQPASQTVTAGNAATFAAAASGTPAPGFQWQVSMDNGANWANLTDGGASPNYLGSATATLTVSAPSTAMNGWMFHCLASNGTAPNATSAAATLAVISTNQAFLQRLFPLVLGRPIDAGALSAYQSAIAGGDTRSDVFGALLGSSEYALWQIEPVIRLYYAALARAPDYAGLQNWSTALHSGALTLAGAADQFATSAEFVLKYGSLDNTQYVQQLYLNVLGRPADPAGLADWVGQLDGGTSRGTVLVGFSESTEFKADLTNQVEVLRLHYLLMQRMPTAAELQSGLGFLAGDGQTDTLYTQGFPAGLADPTYIQTVFQGFLRRAADAGALDTFGAALAGGAVTHAGIVDSLMHSTEFDLDAAPVSRLYIAALLRVPDQPGLDNWVNYVRAGNSLQTMADTFAASQEFINRYGTLSNSDYVAALYVNVLGRSADPAGLASWTALLDAGTTTRGQILIGFSESPEAITLFAPTVRTSLEFFTFLNATPGQQDLDFWKNYLATVDSQLRATFLAGL